MFVINLFMNKLMTLIHFCTVYYKCYMRLWDHRIALLLSVFPNLFHPFNEDPLSFFSLPGSLSFCHKFLLQYFISVYLVCLSIGTSAKCICAIWKSILIRDTQGVGLTTRVKSKASKHYKYTTFILLEYMPYFILV